MHATINTNFDPTAWNNPLTRRRFLKTTGAATAGTILAFHGTSQVSLGGLIFHLLVITAHAQGVPVPGVPGQLMVTVDVDYDIENPDSVAQAVGLGLYNVGGTTAVTIIQRTVLTIPAGGRLVGSAQFTLLYANFNNPPGVPSTGDQMELRLVSGGVTQAWSGFTW